MISNNVLADAILQLASAIHHINMNARSCNIATQVECLVLNAMSEDIAKEINQWQEMLASLKKISDACAQSGGASSGTAAASPVADDTQALSLAELRKHTALLEVLGKQGDAASEGIAVRCDAPLRVKPATAPARVDPFAPVFELDGDGADGKLGVTITLKPGTVVYLVTASGPRSNAITYSAAGPRHLLVRPVVEIEPGS